MKRTLCRPLALVLAVSLMISGVSLTFAEDRPGPDSGTGADSGGHLLSAASARAMTGSVTITSEGQLTEFFPDAAFRTAVFKAVRDGKDGAVGTDVKDALKNFEGIIKANNKGISDIRGIDKLRHAESIDLSKNLIRDFTAQIRVNEKNDPNWDNTQGSADWYGFQMPDGEWRNVTWNLNGNPFTQLPANFGGLLIIKQPATTSSTFPDEPVQVFLRKTAGETFSVTLDMARCRIRGISKENNNIENGYVRLVGSKPTVVDQQKTGAVVRNYSNPERTSDIDVKVEGLLHSGRFLLGVGTEEMLHYKTTDELHTVTPGSQSFKYYVPQPVEVYDRITMTHEGYVGGFTVIKTDEADQPLAGAKFDLYYGGIRQEESIVTGLDGKIERTNIPAGTYILRETKAPDGYIIGDDVEIVVGADAPMLVMSGGVANVTPTAGTPESSNEAMRLIKGVSTPSISMAFRDGTDHTLVKGSIVITYSSLNGGSGRTLRFPESTNTIADAEADLNSRIQAGTVTGPVTVAVHYEGAKPELGNMHPTLNAPNQRKPAPRPISIEKTWTGTIVDSGDIPESIEFTLLQNGTKASTLTLTTSGNSGLSGKFINTQSGNDLWPVADDHGNKYTYTVEEAELLYFASYITTGTDNGNKLTFLAENHSLAEPPKEEPNPPTEEPEEPGEPEEPVRPDPPSPTSSKKKPTKSPWVPEPPDEPVAPSTMNDPNALPPEAVPPEKVPGRNEPNPGTGGGIPAIPGLLLCLGGTVLVFSRRLPK